ncbi:hypothetical protein VPNG_02806 [Cytospora leucostoma]|uniref:Heterokaryon incompatibility domain-containing protein n=1 Tax=Cytospora leucostoma TaxID=1230097 RepID=A0A423XJA6_9PEZI|nr:hypothetical protein VPNG_02806 [Cytospora leucostoma]
MSQPKFPSNYVLRREHLRDSEGWRKVTEDYTRRDLTKASDKLPAMAGLAAQAQTFRPGSRYLSGLWENELPHCLLWEARYPDFGTRIEHTTAPSWSWACLVGGIKHSQALRHTPREEPNAVEDIAVDLPQPPMRSSLYGTLPAGQQTTLIVTALLCDFRVLKVERDRHPSYLLSNNETIQQGSPGQTPINFGGYLVPDSMEDLHSLEAGEPAVLISVTKGERFLVLRKVRERDHTFQRTGIFEMYKTDVDHPTNERAFTKKHITIV